MDNKFINGMKFVVTNDEWITDGWLNCLAEWKGKTLTVKRIFRDGSCTVKENNEEWITADVDWDATEKLLATS